jgi:uncharacterized protein (TIGR03437 family)
VAFPLSRLVLLRDVRLWPNDSPRSALGAAALLLMAGTVAAQGGYFTYPTGISPTGVTAADLNGDGLPDLVIASPNSNSLTVLLNNKGGGFAALAPFNLGQTSLGATYAPQATIAADLNGDNKTDLVVLTAIGPVVLLGNGDGTFQPPLPVSGCPQVYGAQVADINGDGIPDLAVTCLYLGRFEVPIGAYLLVLPGKGDGTFGAGTMYSLENLQATPWAALTIGDFNQDGKPDIAVATGGNLTVFLNDGKGNLTPISSDNEPWSPSAIVAADFNGDGLLDLAVSGQALSNPTNGIITVLLGRGDGTFQAAPSLLAASDITGNLGQLVAMDLNGDGHVDLALGVPAYEPPARVAGLVFFAGRGDGTFENGLPFGGSGNTGYMAFADFTGSGVMGFVGTNDFETPASVSPDGNTVILPRVAWPSLALANTAAAGFGLGPLAPGSIATAFGVDLGSQTAQPTGPPPVSLGAVAVSVTDSAGTARPARLFYVSPTQVNYLIPTDAAPGWATVTTTASGNVTATGQIDIVPVAPALFTVNANSLVAADVVLVSQDGNQTYESIYQIDQNGNVAALPIDFGSETDTVYLVLYGTGIRNRSSLSAVTATIGWALNAPITYAGPQGLDNPDGLDQVNLKLPRSLVSGAPPFTPITTTLQLTVDGQPSNQVTLLIQ